MDFNIILLPIGITEGMVMFLLSMQTGLIDMKLPQRLGAMSIILFIVAASLFQTILEITHPVLLALSASSRNIWSHIKVKKFVIFSNPQTSNQTQYKIQCSLIGW